MLFVKSEHFSLIKIFGTVHSYIDVKVRDFEQFKLHQKYLFGKHFYEFNALLLSVFFIM